MMMRTYLYVLIFSLVTGVAQADEAATAPERSKSFSKVVLWAPGFTPKGQAKIEGKSIKTFTKKGIEAMAMSSLIDNVGQLTNAEILMILNEHNIQAIMTLTDRAVRKNKVGYSSTTPRIAESILVNQAAASSGSGGGATVAGARGSVRMGGQAYKERNQITFGVVLTDLSNGQQVWQDNFVIKSRLENNSTSMAGMALRKAGKQAIKKGVLAPAP